MPISQRPVVYIIGAGPGDPGLITVRGLQCLASADVVLYDRLVTPRLLRHAMPHAERIEVGDASPNARDQEAICYLIAEKAREGRVVARLKWGDPFVFDRGGEEALFLHEHGVPFEIVPGVPAAIGIPSYAGVPVTYPGGGDTLTLIRGHEDESETAPQVDWSALAKLKGTVVCYAGRRQLLAVIDALRQHGLPKTEPAVVIVNGTLPSQTHAAGHARRARRARARDARLSTVDSGRRTRDRAARAPALVRRTAAVRPSDRGDAPEGRRR